MSLMIDIAFYIIYLVKRFVSKNKIILGLLIFFNLAAFGVLAWIVVPLYTQDFSQFPTMRRAMDGAAFLALVILPLFFVDLFAYGFYYIKKNNLRLNISYGQDGDRPTD